VIVGTARLGSVPAVVIVGTARLGSVPAVVIVGGATYLVGLALPT
jgi:hypothetical protein